MGVTHSPPKCFKLDSHLIRFEYLKGHSKYSVLIRLGTGQRRGCVKTSYKAIRGEDSVPWAWVVAVRREMEESGEILGEEWIGFGDC